MFPLRQVPLFSWLLKEYGPCYCSDESGTTYLLSITIGGMLYDLKLRVKNDAIARLVLEFLSQPYIKNIHPKSYEQPWFARCGQYLSKLFFTKKTELSFSEKLALLENSPYTEEQDRNRRLVALKKKGYSYKKDYDFISCEPGENGEERSVSFDEVILSTKKTEKLLYTDYPVLKGSYYKSALTTGMKAATLFTAGLSLFPVASALMPSTPPPSQCDMNNVCNPYNTYELFEPYFSRNLQRNPKGCFTLGADITLNQIHNLPVFKNCDTPFSGMFDTGRYTLRTEGAARSIFGCIDQATVTGRFDFCTDNNRYATPLIAEKVLNGSIINIQQTDSCTIQRPVFGDIVGNNNQITFSGESKEIRVKGDTGIVATQVSGNNNMITVRQAQPHDSPIIFTAGGHNNTYYQQDMNVTRLTNSKLPDYTLLTTNNFTGNATNIIQNNIKATFFTTNNNTLNQKISNAQNKRPDVFSTNVNISVYPPQNEIRLTNISDNSIQRTVLKNNGRVEVWRNNRWQPVCENTFYLKIAHAACKAMGYREAESEGLRLLYKGRLSVVKLTSSPIHLNLKCTGYERNLQDCSTEVDINTCPQTTEAFLSCHNRITLHPSHKTLRLTDHTSNRIDRFDTTNTGTGRLEYFVNMGQNTFCSYVFPDSGVNDVCIIMGFNGGKKIYPQLVPLNNKKQQFKVSSFERENNEFTITLDFNTTIICTDQDDMVIQCNQKFSPLSPKFFRLTERDSVDEPRADTTSTGYGRLEVLGYHNASGLDYFAFCAPNVNNSSIETICKELGFAKGWKSHLTAKPAARIPDGPLNFGWGRSMECDYFRNDTSNCVANNSSGGGFFGRCSQPLSNVVVRCTHNQTYLNDISFVPKFCPRIPVTNTFLFSGSYSVASNCEIASCPIKVWSTDSVKLFGTLPEKCNNVQQVDIANKEDWLMIWNIRCKNSPDGCSCHLPNERLLGFVANDTQHNEAYLVSRQIHAYNEAANTEGFVLVGKLFSNKIPQVLNPVNEVLEPGQLPVNHIIKERHLVGVYPTSNNENVQLFATSLEHGSNTYQAQTHALGGKVLFLTPDTIFIKDKHNQKIISYQLNLIIKNSIEFDLVRLPSKQILLPENTVDTFAATLKNDWFHVAATNDNGMDQIYVISYNVAENSWDPDWRQVDGLTSSNIANHNMVINDCNQIQFLSYDQIMSTNPVSVSMPEFGGCVSFSKIKEAEEFKVTVPTIQPAPAEIVSELPPTSTELTSEASSTIPEISLTSTRMASELTSMSTELASEALSTMPEMSLMSTGMVLELPPISTELISEASSTIPEISLMSTEMTSELPLISTKLTSETPSITLELTSPGIVEATPSVALEPENTDSVQSNNKLILAAAITTTVTCIAGTLGCCCGYNYNKINDYFCKNKKQYNNYFYKINSKNGVSCKPEGFHAAPVSSVREHAANQQEEENTYLQLY